MNHRIAEVFRNQSLDHPLLVAFAVAGDPDYQTSLRIMREMEAAGVGIIELGLPFSDPVADGPVIQRADIRAMEAGMNTDRLFDLVREFRTTSTTPVALLTYTNLVMRRGISRFYRDAAESGIDAVVIADLPYEESTPFRVAAAEKGIDQILMISPTTSPKRLSLILKEASGFIYLVAVMGVTGTRSGVDPDAVRLLQEAMKQTRVPVAPGFGISSSAQIREWADAGARAVIVGSALVRKIEENPGDPDKIVSEIGSLVRSMIQKS
ncbi:MAG TPA: tryptophan synthase subunit alpha [Methanospirillum sp.]|nr:tryptophan synthase subunit alpha [Methanospirillum sp.]